MTFFSKRKSNSGDPIELQKDLYRYHYICLIKTFGLSTYRTIFWVIFFIKVVKIIETQNFCHYCFNHSFYHLGSYSHFIWRNSWSPWMSLGSEICFQSKLYFRKNDSQFVNLLGSPDFTVVPHDFIFKVCGDIYFMPYTECHIIHDNNGKITGNSYFDCIDSCLNQNFITKGWSIKFGVE